jgi:hypothetical protein
MADNKQLKFQFIVDEASLQKTRQLVRELTSDLQKLSAAANQAQIGGGGNGGGGVFGGFNVNGGGQRSPEAARVVAKTPPAGRALVQGFLDQKQIFKGIADGSKDSMRVMTDSLKQAIGFQKRELKDLDNAAKHLTETYDELGRKIRELESKGGKWSNTAGALRDEQQQAGLEHQKIVGERAKAGGDLEKLEGMDPSAGGGGGRFKGFFGPGRFGGGGGWGSMGMKGAAGLAAAIAGVANFGLDEALAGSRTFNSAGARRADMVTGHMNALSRGDVKLIYAMQNMRGNDRSDMMDQTGGFAANAEQIRGGLGHAVANAPMIGGIARLLGIGDGSKGGPGMFGGFNRGTQQSNMADNAMSQAQDYSKTLIMQNMAMDRFQGSLGQRIGAQRMLGIGGLSTYTTPFGSFNHDSYGNLQDKLQRQGYSVEELTGATVGLRGGAGARFGGKYGYTAMAANSEGLGGFSDLMASSARSGGGMQFARGAIGGGIDRYAGVQLGQAIQGTGFDAMGTTSGLGVLAAAQRGMGFDGSAGDFQRAQQVQAGMGLGTSLTTGSLDAYQGARNLVGSVGRLGAGADVYQQDFLANGMNFKQMMDMGMGGKMTATAEAMGLSRDSIKGQLGDSASSLLERYRGSGSTPMGKSIMAYQGSGMNLPDYLQSLKGGDRRDAVKNLGAYFGMQSGQGEEAGLGVMGMLSGMNEGDISKISQGGVGRKIGGSEKLALEGMADAAKKVTKELERIKEGFDQSLVSIPEKFTQFAKFGENLDASAKDFITALTTLTKTMRAANERMGGGAWKGTAK